MELLGPEAWKYRDELEEVKARMGIQHDKFDCWIFKFLENKHFDVDETVAKLQRRYDMERNFLTYDVTEHMKEMMRSGIMQVIGEDKEGRVAMYVVTRRDFPKAKLREERKQNFDMWLSYGTRLRRGEPRCRITLLVNQKDAGVWANTDMTFQTNIAFRIAKFYPGMIDRAYVCCMGNALSAVARPVIKAMPSAISDRIFIYNERQVFEEGKLLEFFEKDVLPTELGGTNDCDSEPNWNRFAEDVEGYFTNVKDALSRGMTVKEYEQAVIDEEERREADRKREEERAAREQAAVQSARNLGINPQQLRRRRQPAVHNAAYAAGLSNSQNQQSSHHHRDPEKADTVSVYTCESEPVTYQAPPVQYDSAMLFTHDQELSVSAHFSHPAHQRAASGCGIPLAAANVARHLEIVDTLLRMESQEALFRESFYQQHEQYMQEFGRLFVSARANLMDGALDDDNVVVDHTGRLAQRCPAPARSATRGMLLTICVLMAIFLLAATVFVLLSGSTIITVLFVAIFVDNLHLYPLGLALIIIGHQCGLIGSRGFELATSALRGQLIRPLYRINDKRSALIGQFVFFFVVCMIALAVFIAFSSTDNPLHGLRVALGSGMYSCAIVLALYHLAFPFGLSPEPRRSRNQGGLSLYLFLDITENEARSQGSTRTSAMMVVAFPAVVALLFGICFMITPSLFFVIATVSTTLGAAFAVNHFVGGNHTNINGNILRATTWIVAVYWITLSFTVGFLGWMPEWQDSIIGSTAVVLYFVFVTWLCYVFREGTSYHRYAFRVAYASCLLLALTGCGLMFYVAWAFGLVVGILMVHSFLCFLRPSSTAMVGSLITTFVTLVIALTIVLYSFQMTDFSDERPTPEFTRRFVAPADLPHPICLQQWGAVSRSQRQVAAGSYGASDFALLNRFSFHRNRTTIQQSVRDAFPGMSLAEVVETPENVARLLVYSDNTTGVTVVSIVPAEDRMGAMSGVTMWAEGIGLQPYASVLPRNWTAAIVDSVSFLTTQFPLVYKSVLEGFRLHLRQLMEQGSSRQQQNARVVLTGYALGGGIASILGAQLSLPTVAFEAPGVLLSRNKFDLVEWNYLKYVTVINSQASLIGGVDNHGSALQTVTCPYDLLKCSRPSTTFCVLQALCGSVANRSLESCDADAPTPDATTLAPPPLTQAAQAGPSRR